MLFEEYAFKNCHTAVFESIMYDELELHLDLPQLKTLVFENNALEGDKNNKKWKERKNLYENKLIMKSIINIMENT